MNLNTIRLEGKLETEEFFHLADRAGHPGHARLVLLRPLGTLERLDAGRPDASPRPRCARRCCACAQHASLLVWLNGSDNPPPANVESAYLQVESETHWPNPILSSASATPTTVTGESGVKMTGPYDYVAPSYWYHGQALRRSLRLQHRNQPRAGDSIARQP